MTALPLAVRPRVAQFVRLLASNHDGEVVAAARATARALKAAGMSINDLADEIEREPAMRIVYRDRPYPPPQNNPAWSNSGRHTVVVKLQRAIEAGALTPWERDFAASIVGQISTSRTWRPTPKQEQRLDALMAKLKVAGVWE